MCREHVVNNDRRHLRCGACEQVGSRGCGVKNQVRPVPILLLFKFLFCMTALLGVTIHTHVRSKESVVHGVTCHGTSCFFLPVANTSRLKTFARMCFCLCVCNCLFSDVCVSRHVTKSSRICGGEQAQNGRSVKSARKARCDHVKT